MAEPSQKQKLIQEALAKLDPDNADHWTSEGLPRLDAVAPGGNLKRQEVTAAAPHFTRQHPSFELPEAIQRKLKIDAERAEIARQKAALEAKERGVIAEEDKLLEEQGQQKTEKELMLDIQAYHRRGFQMELEEAAKMEEARLAVASIGISQPSAMDVQLAKDADNYRREQTQKLHEKRS